MLDSVLAQIQPSMTDLGGKWSTIEPDSPEALEARRADAAKRSASHNAAKAAAAAS